MNVPSVSIGEVAAVNPRFEKADRPDPQDPVSFVPMAAVSEETVSIVDANDRPYGEVAKGYTAFRRGDVLIAKITPCFENGKMALADNLPRELGFGSTEFHVIRASEKIDPRYLFNLLRNPYIRRAGEMKMKGAAGQRRVPADFFAGLRIPLPPLEEQKRIAKILDAADALRVKRRESLAQIDALLQSTFLDLFGDPVENSRGWEELPLEEIVVDSKIGLVRSSKEFGWDLTVPYVRMDAVSKDGKFLADKVQFTEASQKEIAASSLLPGDFLFNTRNSKELVGKSCIYTGPEGWLFNNNLMRIRFIDSVCPEVVATQFHFSRVSRELEQRKSGTTNVFAVYWKNLKSLPVLVPPKELQVKYVALVRSVNKQSVQMNQHLDELNELFSSLQQKAFSGEL